MVKIIPLGGLGEIGLNMMVFECQGHVMVIDAGLMFPDDFMPGVDLVIPDFQYLREKKDNLGGIVLTHGHEDHIGAMPFFLREFSVPVYGTCFTLEILKEKLKECGLLEKSHLVRIKPGDRTPIGPFEVEYISVNHSIVDGVGLAIHTPEGIFIHSGDFKVDPTPVDGQFTDLNRFAHYGSQEVLALLSDSTNAEKEGFTLSEREVKKTLEGLFQESKGRIIVAIFASNISRIQQVIDLAIKYGRKVLFNGKSMVTNVKVAKKEHFLNFPSDVEISEREIHRIPDQELVLITTGSQGEPMSALARMAQGQHKNIKIKQGDTVILSSRFIPGNERAITAIINNLYQLGAEVVYEKVSDIHSSGHAKKEELKLMLGLVKPKYFIPIHGEYRHLVKHCQVAVEMGIPQERVLLAKNGTVLCFENGTGTINGSIQTGRVLVDGKGVGDIGETVLRERRRLSENGVVIVMLAVDEQTGDIIYGPDIISRGFVFEEQSKYILEDAKCVVLEVLDEIGGVLSPDNDEMVVEIERKLKKFFYSVIERRPLVLPLIIPI